MTTATHVRVDFLYSFLLSSINIRCHFDLQRAARGYFRSNVPPAPDCDSLDEFFDALEQEKRPTTLLHLGTQQWLRDLLTGPAFLAPKIREHFNGERRLVKPSSRVIHLSEEEVPLAARLPLYHLFPHISVGYELCGSEAGWSIVGANSDPAQRQELLSGLAIVVHAFVFESGAGMLGLSIRKQGGDPHPATIPVDPEGRRHLMSLSSFIGSEPDGCGRPRQPVLLRNHQQADCSLHDLYLRELTYFQDMLRHLGDNADALARASERASTECPELVQVLSECANSARQFSRVRSMDEQMLAGLPQSVPRNSKYHQRPYIILGAELAGTTNSSATKLVDELSPWLSVNAGKSSVRSLSEVGLQFEGAFSFGRTGSWVSAGSAAELDVAMRVVVRITGSVRLLWHAMTIMSTHLGSELRRLSDVLAAFEKDSSELLISTNDSNTRQEKQGRVDTGSLERRLETCREGIREMRSRLHAFQLAEDPLVNAVHFSSYGASFAKFAGQFNFASVRMSLQERVTALDNLERRSRQRLYVMKSRARATSRFVWLVVCIVMITFVLGAFLIWDRDMTGNDVAPEEPTPAVED